MSWWARDITVTFGRTVALDHVSLEIEPGRTHAIIGGDGAGKSTLLAVLAGLDLGQTGDAGLPAPEQIGFVPSSGGVFDDLTVDENISFVADAYHLRHWQRRRDQLLERAAVGQFRDRLVGRLSGGQRRKVAGVMALLPRPDLLVLDEVTTGVDPVSRMELWRLVATAARDGAGVVVATTYLDEAERMEHVTLLHEGRVLATGSPTDVVAGVPGSVLELDAPTDPATAWRAGRRWRQWVTSPADGADRRDMTLEDAAIVLELAAGRSAAAAPIEEVCR